MSPEETFLSLIVLLVLTIFWPLAIFISSIQAFKQNKLELANLMPLIVVVVLVGLLTVSGLAAFTKSVM